MLRPNAPALFNEKSGVSGADDISNSQQHITEYFPELILVHNKCQLEDFTPRRMKKVQKFYANIFAKQFKVGQINWKYGTGLVRMTKAMPHLYDEDRPDQFSVQGE